MDCFIRNKKTNFVLDVKGKRWVRGGPIVLWSEKEGNNSNQRWDLGVKDGMMTIKSKHTNLYIDIVNGKAKKRAELHTWIEKEKANNQQWVKEIKEKEGEYFVIRSKQDENLVMDVDSMDLGSRVFLGSYEEGRANQLWRQDNEGEYFTRNASSDGNTKKSKEYMTE